MHRALLTFASLYYTAGPASLIPRPAADPGRRADYDHEVDATDNVYIFRNQNSQAMFVVTSDGVIATDPVGYGRPQGGAA